MGGAEAAGSVRVPRGDNEGDAESLFRYVGHNYGSRFQAYIPIVGSGPNSAALHYNDNQAVIPEGSLVLVDAGAEVGATRNGGGYGTDITRTVSAVKKEKEKCSSWP